MYSSDQKLAFAICEYLQQCTKNGTIKSDDVEGIEVATQCIAEAFGIDGEDGMQSEGQSSKPANLLSIFNVFLSTQKKLVEGNTDAPAGPSPTDVQNKAQAELCKAEGNKMMAAKQFLPAIEKYTEAITLDSTNPVYYANRAAAHSQNGNHESAAADARLSISTDPSYSKGFSRLGHALFCLGKYPEAISAYEDGLKIEPGNASMQQALKTASSKLEASVSTRGASSAGDAAQSGMPDLSSLGGLGGMDFASMMSNPNFMSMAAKMMNNPQIAEMMKNPEMAKMAQNMMSDPSALSGLLNNPEIASMAEKFGKK
ncbi:hypothetical protein BASA50_010927 [Batrachochytrium salamandrivorans]|uniref:STI1 domain-containing protein n=1 Tax=Batrachochytrium salamandrivorans TaxID=1357716 RepID=A0ABQ8EX83_9FUNG|nr:hypothetical protein BASA50_010927 [Batrachochytrium salamandrivorans]KAH9252681.1 hypothetical protein BASA81_009373 [Batrachochytrium salamandrivorans]KAH9267517.1 hypothetical protein BASA83_009907 [Batrachochytrium salamandrivorans]